MNLAGIKEIFYKRYEASGNFLHYTFAGKLCSLLGHDEIQGAPFVSCTLSMGIAMLARRLEGNVIQLQSTDSDRHFSYTPHTPPALFKGREKEVASELYALGNYLTSGAEILYNSTVPSTSDTKTEFNLALTKSVLKVCGAEKDPLETASLAAADDVISGYLAAEYSRSGYCTLISDSAPRNYPLPLSGYKVVTAYCHEKDKNRSDRIQAAFERIRRKYPPVSSLSDIGGGHIACLKDKTAAGYLYHLEGERNRIKAAIAGLKGCDIKPLFHEMNASQRSMEKYWRLGSEHLYLARCTKGLDGVMAARCTESGITIIAEEDYVDYIVRMIKNDFENNIGYQPTFCVSETA